MRMLMEKRYATTRVRRTGGCSADDMLYEFKLTIAILIVSAEYISMTAEMYHNNI